MFKDRTPRRRPAQQRRRPNPVGFLLSRWRVLLALLPVAAVGGIAYAAVSSPVLTVQTVRVNGIESLDRDGVIQISGLKGKSMLDLPLDEARQALLEIPTVKSVSITKNWPQSVTITLVERRPVAYWSVGGRDYPVDADGVVLAAGAVEGSAPRIVEPDSGRIMGPGDRVHPDAIALARRVMQESPRFLGEEVDLLEYRPGVGITAVFGNGMRVTFGDERSYDYKLAVLSNLLNELQAQGYTPHAVDLRFGERVTYE